MMEHSVKGSWRTVCLSVFLQILSLLGV
jgi:hypothetical protein